MLADTLAETTELTDWRQFDDRDARQAGISADLAAGTEAGF